MHARVARVQFQTGKTEAGIRVYQDEVLAYASQQPGFVDAFLLLDRDTGVAISISLWETEEAMTTGEWCFWGAGFGREDGMHFEASEELVRMWKARGVI